MQQNAPTLKSCCKLLHWAGKAYLLVWRILLHLAGVVFVIPPGFCYLIAEFPIAYCCIWHGSCLGTLHSVAFSRVLREYPVRVRVLREYPVRVRVLREYPVRVRVLREYPVRVRVLREYPVRVRVKKYSWHILDRWPRIGVHPKKDWLQW